MVRRLPKVLGSDGTSHQSEPDSHSGTSSHHGPPLTTANIETHDHDLNEQLPQASQTAATKGKPVISLPSPAVWLAEQIQTPPASQTQDYLSCVKKANLSQGSTKTTSCGDRRNAAPSLTVNPSFNGQRSHFERSSSLEVHASSPTPEEVQLEESESVSSDLNDEKPQELGAPEVIIPIKEKSVPVTQSQFAGWTFSTIPNELNSLVIPTSQIPSATSPPGNRPLCPARSISPLFLTNTPVPVAFQRNQRLATIQEAVAYPIQTLIGPVGQSLQSLHKESIKYPPCWISKEGLLIVPSVPGEFPEEKATRLKPPSHKLVAETASSTKNKNAKSSEGNISVDDHVDITLSPNVTYRKGKYPRRRNPSYYDPDILPRRSFHI